MTKQLIDLAKTIRSKNAGVDAVTFDVIFDNRATYEAVRDSACLTPESVSDLYSVSLHAVTDFVWFEPGMALKFTLRRDVPAGGPGDADMFGAQQYPPLFGVEITC